MRFFLIFIILFFIVNISGLVFAESNVPHIPIIGNIGILLVWLIDNHVTKKNKGIPIGIDGFLLYFILVHIIGAISEIIYSLIIIWSQIITALPNVIFLVLILISIILEIAFIYVSIQLWKRNARAVQWAKILLIAQIATTILTAFVAFVFPTITLTFGGSGLISTVAYSIFWILYFSFSGRVRNTFAPGAKLVPTSKTSLAVIGAIVIIGALISFFISLATAVVLDSSSDQLYSQLRNTCQTFCTANPAATSFDVKQNPSTLDFDCICVSDTNIVAVKPIYSGN